jgi:hypothetical protein
VLPVVLEVLPLDILPGVELLFVPGTAPPNRFESALSALPKIPPLDFACRDVGKTPGETAAAGLRTRYALPDSKVVFDRTFARETLTLDCCSNPLPVT